MPFPHLAEKVSDERNFKMHIKTIHIDSFGGVRGLTLDLAKGLNIIEGNNESGKSSVAMFIKFIFYGLSGRGVDGALSERRRYVNWETGSAAGYIILEKNGVTYRISRELYVSDDAARERVSVINEETGEKMFKGEVPGMALLKMPEQMFYNSVFVRQLSDASIDGTGMSEAIENILYSGDEEVSTRRALDRLEKARKALLHKNGSGGKIYDLRREKARLEGELQEARIKNAEIMDIESAVADSSDLISSRELHAAELQEIIDCYDAFRRLDSLEELEKLEFDRNKMKAMLDSYPPREEIEKHCDELRKIAMKRSETEHKLKNVRMNINALDKTLPPLLTAEEKERDRMDVIGAERALSKKKSSFGFSLALFMLTVVCGAGALFLLTIDKMLAIIAGASAAVMLIIAIVLLCGSISSLKRYNSILDKWNAQTIDDIERMAQQKIEDNIKLRSEDSEYGRLHRDEIAINTQRESIISEQRIAASRYADEEPDTDTMTENALANAASTIKEIATYTREYDIISGKLSVMGTKTAEERTAIRNEANTAMSKEAGKKAAELRKAEYEKIVRDRGFFLSTAEAQRRRHTELEKKLGALCAVAVSPSDIAEKINTIDAELNELTAKYSGIALAIETITKAGENLRASLLPRIVGEAGALLGAFTGGKYTGIGVDRNFQMSYSPAGYTRESDYMSAGTRDAAYLSLRSALMKVLFHKDTPMAIYDESFARIDESRLARLLAILSAAGEEGMQSLVFTCRSIEGHASGEGVPVIKL